MRILLTGATSFTGAWFAHTLAKAGHEVIAPLRAPEESYAERRRERLDWISPHVEIVSECPFGTDPFLTLARSRRFDVLCHHAARVADYRSPDFDVPRALAENTRELPAVLRALGELRAVVLTGTVFEQDEGAGSAPLRAFSPYGLSKGLTAQVFRLWCELLNIPLRKFVIPNPFGPLEEPRFPAYLARQWLGGQAAEVRTPLYVRDNIHVDLLAAAYAAFVAGDAPVLRPSLYVETQGTFTRRYASEIARRSRLDCVVTEATQTDFSEPLTRIGTDPVRLEFPGWSEAKAWDAIAETIESGETTPTR